MICVTNDTVLILFNRPAKLIQSFHYLTKENKPSKKAKAGIMDNTKIDETNTHVVSPVLIQLIVSLLDIYFFFFRTLKMNSIHRVFIHFYEVDFFLFVLYLILTKY